MNVNETASQGLKTNYIKMDLIVPFGHKSTGIIFTHNWTPQQLKGN